MSDMECHVQCHTCKKVFTLPYFNSPLPAHKIEDGNCPGSNKEGLFLTFHPKKKKC